MIIGGMLVKNESKRWLKQTCDQMKYICDKVVIVDDKSSDNTIEICKDYGFKVYESNESLWEKNEVQQRKKLFNECLKVRHSKNDWILILDADELIPKKQQEYLKFHMNTTSLRYDVFAFRLYDMWNKTHYRDDIYWCAHHNYWPMACRIYDCFNLTWNEKALHCGRFPLIKIHNLYDSHFKIMHMGWSTEKDRKIKYERYMKIDPNAVYGIKEQYESILDKKPNLVRFTDD